MTRVEAAGPHRPRPARLVPQWLHARLSERNADASAGIVLALMTAVISGFAIFINSYAVQEFASPTVFVTFKNTVVGALLIALLIASGRPAASRRPKRMAAPALVALGIVGGSVPFVLFFEGLARVSAGNAAFIHKTMFVWVAALALLLLRERLGRWQLAALGALLVAQLLLRNPWGLRPEAGVLMVAAATLLWSAEVVIAKRLLGSTPVIAAASARMGIGAALLLAYLAVSGRSGDLASLTASQWAWGLGTAVILLAYVTTWYAALKRAPATTVTCVLTVGAPVTAALNALAGRRFPAPEELVAYAVLALGALAFALLARRATARSLAGAPA